MQYTLRFAGGSRRVIQNSRIFGGDTRRVESVRLLAKRCVKIQPSGTAANADPRLQVIAVGDLVSVPGGGHHGDGIGILDAIGNVAGGQHGDARNWHQTHLQASYDCDLPGWNAW